MALFSNYSAMYAIPITSKDKDQTSYYLGRKFKSTIYSQRDQRYINDCRRKIEELKLQIIDAAESGQRPPALENVRWLAKVQTGAQEYRFLYAEFDEWLALNGLSGVFYGYGDNLKYYISVSTYVPEEAPPEPDVKSLLNNITRPPEIK
jgi:hypothetical protein